MRESIIEILDKNEVPLSEIDILDRLSFDITLEKLCEELREMEKVGDVYLTKKNKYTLFKYTHLKVGKLSVSKKGFGFVILNNEPDLHIKKENLNGAIHNDTVVAEYISDEEGRIVKIIDRSYDTIIGEYIEVNSSLGKIIVDDSRIKLNILIDKEHRNNAMPGHKVIVKPYKQINNVEWYGEIVKILGHKDDVGVDILSIVYEHDIEPIFSDAVMQEVLEIPQEVTSFEINGRIDLRGVKTVTIDGDDAKDFDDAISATKLENGNIKVIVSIADVTHYVKEGTNLYREAEERATSVYLVDRVIPMLPHQLSNGICSLNPNVDRLTISCEMEINKEGKVIDYDIYESVINSSFRMTYKKANMYLENKVIPEGYEEFTDLLDNAYEASLSLRKMKFHRGQIDFDVPEVKIIVDEECKPIEIKERERGTGEKLIEDLMIVANETVATYITNLGYPMVYRVHDKPIEKRMREYLALLKTLGHNVKLKGKIREIEPKQIQLMLSNFKNDKNYQLLCEFGLRAMAKAEYKIENLGHFGLASKCYCHFTSPIRRWPDQAVHRILKKILNGVEFSGRELIDIEKQFEREAEHSSLKERNSIECERAVEDMKMAEYMQEHIGETYKGVIVSIVPSGMFVRLDNRVEGKVHVATLTGDYYIVDEITQTIFGKRTGKKYRLGDEIKVIVTNASKQERIIDFEVVKESIVDEEEKEN